MRVLIVYRPNSAEARSIEEFVGNFSRQNPDKKLELLDIDTRDGIATASLYDIMSNPAILALTDDGQVIRDWRGSSLPAIIEVSYYASP